MRLSKRREISNTSQLYKTLRYTAKKVRRLVLKLRGDSSCMCSVASTCIFLRLQKLGIESQFCGNDNHTFLKSNGFFIDVTADQFKYKTKVVVRKKLPETNFWKIIYSCANLEDYKKVEESFPYNQQSVYYSKEIQEFLGNDHR